MELLPAPHRSLRSLAACVRGLANEILGIGLPVEATVWNRRPRPDDFVLVKLAEYPQVKPLVGAGLPRSIGQRNRAPDGSLKLDDSETFGRP